MITLDEARRAQAPFVTEPLKLERGDVEAALRSAPRRLKGSMRVGGQEHFYLEGQVALAVPGEDDDVTVHSSTQHPSEIQHIVSHVLAIASNAVTVEVRRMGGAFGGKETQGNLFACVAALAAKKLGRAVKCRPDRDDDMTITGKRHDFLIEYEVGLRRARRHRSRGHGLCRALRLLGRSFGPGDRSRALPCRQLLFLPERPRRFAALQDQYLFEHGLSRLRRPARNARGRTR